MYNFVDVSDNFSNLSDHEMAARLHDVMRDRHTSIETKAKLDEYFHLLPDDYKKGFLFDQHNISLINARNEPFMY